ncbi:extracellular solute-binding protein [Streptomyces sp. 3MP-14]|uniref:Extracellular solute-binding protein n=1 Tax=Streptomyces mimosae TaxID=2586635 RepID=A0A5N6ADF3_9ACTN|nr:MULTISPECIES: sugar ABC transporter substrate-binding protein [Streptomyces]KAB8166275.1 extracellular solute-binding protein [Streptomyces mimosae]KAB8174068.1 extracellular solute-binding protein [Streptomyces sp. 3MP-14]
MTRHHRGRRVRAGLAAATAGVILTSCGIGEGFEGEPELSEGDVTISFNWWGADARTQMTLEAIELFEEEYPNINVEPQYADWTGYWDRLATMTAAGEMPDVSQFDQLYLAAYAERGALLDLGRVSEFLDTSTLGDELLDSGRVRGDLYAVPTGGTANGIIINTSLFAEYGVELPDVETWTWDDLTRAAVELTEASDGEVHGISPFGSDSFSLTVWARQHGGQLFNDEGELVLDPEILASYWEQELAFIDSGASPSVAQLSETQGLPLDQGDLVTGKTAMGFIPAGQFNAFQAAAPDFDLRLADWPTNPETEEGYQYLKPSMYWATSSTTQHPAESALLIDFLVNDPRVGEIFGLDRGEPGNPEFREVIEPTLDESSRRALAFTNQITQEVGPTPPITPAGASDIEVLLGRYNQRVQFGDASPREAAEDLINELNDSIRAAS